MIDISRVDFLSKEKIEVANKKIARKQALLFLPNWDTISYGHPSRSQRAGSDTLILVGVGEDKRKMVVCLENIRWFFDISLSGESAEALRADVRLILMEICSVCKQQNVKCTHILSTEIVMERMFKRYGPPKPYLRIYYGQRSEFAKHLQFVRERIGGKQTVDSERIFRNREIAYDDLSTDRIFREYGIEIGSWFEITNYVCRVSENILHVMSDIKNIALCQNISHELSSKDVLCLFWDIETFSESQIESNTIQEQHTDGKHILNGEDGRNTCFIISMVFAWSSAPEPFLKIALTTLRCPALDGIRVIAVSGEKELLSIFAQIIDSMKPDIISGFNDWNFDWHFILGKARHLQVENFVRINSLSKFFRKCQRDESISTNSIAIKIAADAALVSVDIPMLEGAYSIDTMIIMRRTYPRDTEYSLKHFLKELGLPPKKDMPYDRLAMIYHRHREALERNVWPEELIEDVKKAVEYCVHDSVSCCSLWDKANILMNHREIASTANVSLMSTYVRAGGHKVRNIIAKEALAANIAISLINSTKVPREIYPGACVLEPRMGLYCQNPVGVLDFQSLYPSIIMTYNLSPEMVVEGEDTEEIKAYRNGARICNLEIDMGNRIIRGFSVLHGGDERRKGLYVRVMEKLARWRSELKKKMETDKNNRYLNAKQAAVKVFMNTFYGETGNSDSPVFKLLVAAGITSIGRKHLLQCKTYCIAHNFDVLYGDTDSVFITPHSDHHNTPTEDKVGAIKKTAGEIAAVADQLNTLLRDEGIQMGCIAKTAYLKLNFERIMFPFCLCGKKKYFAFHYEKYDSITPGSRREDIYKKGIEVIKRGNAPILTSIGYDIMLSILNHLTEPFEAVKTSIQKLYDGTYSMSPENFVLRKTYRSDKMNKQLLEFVNRMKNVHGIVIKNGEEIAYVYVKDNKYSFDGRIITKKKSQQMMQYDYFMRHHCTIDIGAYIKGSISGMLARFICYRHQSSEDPVKEATLEIKSLIKEHDGEKKYLSGVKQGFKEDKAKFIEMVTAKTKLAERILRCTVGRLFIDIEEGLDSNFMITNRNLGLEKFVVHLGRKKLLLSLGLELKALLTKVYKIYKPINKMNIPFATFKFRCEYFANKPISNNISWQETAEQFILQVAKLYENYKVLIKKFLIISIRTIDVESPTIEDNVTANLIETINSENAGS